jgi:hypothetical protein
MKDTPHVPLRICDCTSIFFFTFPRALFELAEGQKKARRMEVSMEQVRAHLQQMGFSAVPDEVVRELHSELLNRISHSTVTPKVLPFT